MNLEVEDPLYATVQRRNNNSGRKKSARGAAAAATDTSPAALLELAYGAGAHRAAAVIQRAYRAHRLQSQFSRLMSLAMSADRLDRRLSLLGPGKDADSDLTFKELLLYAIRAVQPTSGDCSFDKIVDRTVLRERRGGRVKPALVIRTRGKLPASLFHCPVMQ